MSESTTTQVDTTETSTINDKVYDALKLCALIVFPAIAALYLTLAGLWDLPEPDKVAGTIVAVDTFLGVLLAFLKRGYDNSGAPFDGSVVPEKTDDGIRYTLDINPDVPLDGLGDKGELRLKIQDVA